MSVIPEPLNKDAQITAEVIQQILRTGQWAPDPALTLVINDMQVAEGAKTAKQWIAGWNASYVIYQSTTVPRYWEGTQQERANIPFYTVAKNVNSLTPQILSGLFYDDPPFYFEPRPGTRYEAVEANSNVIAYQLKQIGFKEEVRLGIVNAVLFGTNIWKWGWDSYEKTETYLQIQDQKQTLSSGLANVPGIDFHSPDAPLEEATETYKIEQPRFENITSIKDVLVDPTLRVPDIRKAKYVIHRQYLTFNDLDKLRGRPGYDIPSRQEVAMWFAPPAEEALPAYDEQTGVNQVWDMRSNPRWSEATEDPFEKPLEVLERWDNDKVIIVVQRKKVICNGKNPYGCIPFFSVGWWDVPSAFYSLGMGRIIGSEQRLQQGIVNTWLDNTALNLAGVFVRKRGKSIMTQSIRIHPGRVFEVDEITDMKPLERTPAIPEAGEHLAMSQARVELNSGSGEITSQGVAGRTGHSNLARTATGAGLIGAGQGVAIAEFVDKFANQVFIPFLYAVDKMNRRLLPAEIIKDILNNELQSSYFQNNGSIEEIRNARTKFDIQAGAKLNERRAMAASLPLLIQFLTNQFIVQGLALEGKKVNTTEVVKQMVEASGYKLFYDFIVDMTPQEKQTAMQNQPGAIAAQNRQAQQAQLMMKLKNAQEITDQNATNRAALEVLRHDFEVGATPQTEGQLPAPGVGYGNSEPEGE